MLANIAVPHGCRRRTSHGSVFGEGPLDLCLTPHLVTWADAMGASLRIVGFCIHGNACFTYHFLSNNGKLNI